MKIKIKNIPAALEKIEHLNKRAKKLGLPALAIQFKEKQKTDEIEFMISGSMPVLNGWHLVATINHEDADQAIINVIPGETLLEIYRKSRTCEHCNTDRNRKDTFVVQHENGEYKQVGRQCLADFIGDCDPALWLKISLLRADAFDVLIGCDSDEWEGWKSSPSFTLQRYLDYAEAAIWAFGWANSKSEMPTKSVVWTLCEGGDSGIRRAFQDEIKNRTENGKRKSVVDIDAVIAWAKALPENSNNDYLYNIKVIADSGYVTRKTAGYAASMIMTYQCELAKKLEIEQTAAQSKHFGIVGKREIFELTLERTIPIEGFYGITYLHIFYDTTGNKAIWYGSKCLQIADNPIKLKATVKDHNQREGVAQTVLTRCAAIN